MDPDFNQPYKQSPTKVYSFYSKKSAYYPDLYQKPSKTHNRKQQYYPKNVTQSKPTYKPQNKDLNMNQLAPRFQQRALYSQNYRTDYDASWRANLLAANCRNKYYNKDYETNVLKRISNLGIRPEPEGAPSNKLEEVQNPTPCIDYDKVLNEDSVLYSDYGSDTDDFRTTKESKSFPEPDDNIPDSTWSTASLITYAFNKANCNKVTVMSYAVIGAELHSITKLHTSKTEIDLMKISKRTQKLTENIDKARKSLKEIALGLRACKQEIKSKTNKFSNAHEKQHKHSYPVIIAKSNFSSNSQDTDKRFSSRKSMAMLEQVPWDQVDESKFPNYCTIDRRHRYHKERRSKRVTAQPFSMLNYMNLDGVDKSSSLD